MAFDIQPWNPALLAQLSNPNVPDFAGRISQMQLNDAQRNKLLAEIAFLPAQKKSEELKNQAYLMQQGYMIDPQTGQTVMTPAKAAETEAIQSGVAYLRRQMGLGDGTSAPQQQPQFLQDAGMPTGQGLPDDIVLPTRPEAVTSQPLGGTVNPRAQAVPTFQQGAEFMQMPPSLQEMATAPMQQPPALPNFQLQEQIDADGGKSPYDNNFIRLAGLAGGKLGDPTDMIAMQKLDFDKQKEARDAAQSTPAFKAQVKMGERVSEKVVDKLDDLQTKADSAVESMYGINQANSYLDSGIITGKGADFILQFGKGLEQMGLGGNGDEISDTEAYVTGRALEVAKVITNFGAGTGLSDKDREYAEKVAAGTIALDEKSIRKILADSEKANKRLISLYNNKAARYYDVPEMKKAYAPIEVPKFDNASTPTAKGAATQGNAIITQDEYNKLPSGSVYTAPDGTQRTKK